MNRSIGRFLRVIPKAWQLHDYIKEHHGVDIINKIWFGIAEIYNPNDLSGLWRVAMMYCEDAAEEA